MKLTGILSDSIIEEVVSDVKVLPDTSLALEVLLSILKQLLSLQVMKNTLKTLGLQSI